jgi:hypothetical protein
VKPQCLVEEQPPVLGDCLIPCQSMIIHPFPQGGSLASADRAAGGLPGLSLEKKLAAINRRPEDCLKPCTVPTR